MGRTTNIVALFVGAFALATGCLGAPPVSVAQPAGTPKPGSKEVLYQCPDLDGLLFGNAELSPTSGTYHIPVCLSGTFLGKLVEFKPIVARLIKSDRWNMDVRLRKSLDISEHGGFDTAQRARDFVKASLEAAVAPKDPQGRTVKPVQY
jgi:hypothetical protein